MANNLVKRMVKKDGSQRISFYRDEYAENPRDMTDEPLHCEDWSREYSIMNKHERETKSDNACKWIRYMLERYGNANAIFEVLRENAKSDKHNEGDNALVYDKSRHEWILNYWNKPWKDYNGAIHGNCWSEEVSFCCKIKDLTAWDVASYLSDEQIEEFADEKYFTDGIKIMSYGFGSHGDISFYHEFSTDSEGICWLEKDEFLKYAGGDNSEWVKKEEQVWNSKSLDEITGLLDELKAWGDNEVYGFVVEQRNDVSVHEESANGGVRDYVRTDWNEIDSCWGFYGELNKSLDWILGSAGFKIEELTEVSE